MKEGGDQFIVSKIETKNGFQNIRDIAKVSDFIMVATIFAFDTIQYILNLFNFESEF